MAETQIFDPEGDVTFIFTNKVIEKKEKSSGANSNRCEPVKASEIRMRLSSKILKLLSTVFKAMLKHSFNEGEALRSAGFVEIPLPDDDPVAFAILMNISHGKSHHIPRQTSLQTLFHFAVLVDKYSTFQATTFFANLWLE